MRKKKLEYRVEENGCFVVTSHRLNKDGYSGLYHNGRHQRAHRLVYQECFGELPDDLVVRHKCDNPCCINPEHLESGTHTENMRDAVNRRRNAYGERNGRTVINEETAREVKRMVGEGKSTIEIMKELNLKEHIVRRIRERKAWKYIDL